VETNNEIVELGKKALAIDEQAKAITIRTPDEYKGAAEFCKTIKGLQKKVKEAFGDIIEKAYAAHKAAKAKETEHLEPLLKAEAFVKSKMVAYDNAQEELRRKEQERLNRIADAERRKKEEQEAELRRKEEAKRAEAERLEREAAQIKNAEARAEAEKAAAKARAEAEKAAAKADEKDFQAQNVIAPIAAQKVEAVKGVSYSTKYTAEVVDFAALPDDYKLPDMSKLNKVIQATKGEIKIPGVKVNTEKVMRSGSI
jgi:multidrug efflux pump subunit AcrA (membrane-fusion protein)